jgi:hypothetical protein
VPVVRQPLAWSLGLAAPDVSRPLEPATGGVLPFGLRRQRLPRPGRVRLGVLVCDVDNRVVLAAVDRALGSVGVPPAGARRPRPPLVEMPQIDGPRRHREHERPGHQVLSRCSRKVGRVERPFGDRHVAGVVDEVGELPVLHLKAIDPEAVNRDGARGSLLRVVRVRAHPARPGGDPGHVLRRFRRFPYWPAVSEASSLATAWSIVKLAAF